MTGWALRSCDKCLRYCGMMTLVVTTSRPVLMAVAVFVSVVVRVIVIVVTVWSVLVAMTVCLWFRLGLAILSPTSDAMTPEAIHFPEMFSSL